MPERYQLTLNTVLTTLTTVMLAIFGFIGVEAYKELRVMHDRAISTEFQIVDLRARMAVIEMDWAKWKEKHP